MRIGRAFSEFFHKNRTNIVFFALVALIALSWNVYVRTHDDGMIIGRVVDETGSPVAGATVLVAEKTLELLKNREETVTNRNGEFRFENQEKVEFVVQVSKEGYERTQMLSYHLYFKGQNFELPKPIVLEKALDDD